MMRASRDDSELQEAINSIDLKDWLDSEGIGYRNGAAGQVELDRCPFCGGSHRIYVSTETKLGKCFHGRCGEGFNFWKLARQHLETDNRATFEHIKRYAERLGFRMKSSASVKQAPMTTGWQMPVSVALPTSTGGTHPYLISRRILPETQDLFRLRWSERGVFPYRNMEGEERVMSFANRILIPVCDLDGTVHTFQGRDTTGTAERRYLFPPGLPGTGRFLYGAELVAGLEHVVMGEGPIDTHSIHQALKAHPDFRHMGAIGSFGLSISQSDAEANDQLSRFRQLKTGGLKRVTIMWDAEPAAWQAAITNGMLLVGAGLKVFLATLPVGADPNEVDSRVVREAVENALPLTRATYPMHLLRAPFA